ncbi:putative centromere binding protein b [Lyophyllum shimeji]|uniref:Centromere binding protein b n=1 Tax=Lyophyllum shimeji TaxID=47721 RepID=A0A9P3PLD3_LYOSH|nr:putative centromere binding protein b [Lyophyllum shimeji]
MESAAQSFAVYSPIAQLNSSSAAANQLHASLNESSWHHARMSAHGLSLTPVSSSMFPVSDRPPDLEYPSPAPSTASPPYAHPQHTEQYTTHPQSPSVHMAPANDDLLSQFSQVESRVGPSRVMTRRQRAQLEQKSLGRRGSFSQQLQRGEQIHSPRHSSALYSPTRLHASSNEESAQLQRDRLSLNIAGTVPLQLQSTSYHPMTPTSMSSPSYSYQVYGHSRSTSGSNSNHQRAPSPALSCVSALTSVSSASGPASHAFSPYPRPSVNSLPTIGVPKPKQKKQRLDNAARKSICLYHDAHPNARQEDIAVVYKVERSTISKILKHKTKWLNTPDNQGDRVAKHRPSKFPEIEEEMEKWLEDCTQKKVAISDNAIRAKAKETARRLNIAEEKFKASSGWVENFKSRHNIRGGAWMAHDRAAHTARLVLDWSGSQESVLSPLNPSLGGRNERREMSTTAAHRDDDMDSRPSSGPGTQQGPPAGEQHISASPPMSAHSAWTSQSNNVPSAAPIPQPPLPAPPTAEQSSALGTHQSDAHVSSHQHAPKGEHPVQQPYIEQAVYYHPEPPGPAALPTLAEAEAAMNTLITYIDSARRDLLLPEERRTLSTIRYALFQEASGVPFDRATQA